MQTLKAALADAMHRARVELGPGDPTQTSAISVLPAPPSAHEGRSTAMPTYFDLALKDGACLLVRRDTGQEYALSGVSCRPLRR